MNMKIDLYKRTLRYLLASAGMLYSATLSAQNEEYTPLAEPYDFLAVKNIKIETTHIFDENGMPVVWTGEDLRAGMPEVSLLLFNCKDIQKNVAVPDNPSFICEIRDMEGNIKVRSEKDLTNTFKKLKFTSSLSSVLEGGGAVPRGGEYWLTAKISPGLFSYETLMTLLDDPGIQVVDRTSTGKTYLCPEVTFTSGYPYDPAEYSGEKHLHWQIAPVNSPAELIVEKDEVFELKSEIPTLAAVDTLYLPVENLVPGEYLYTLTSDYAPANYSFIAKVNDVLIPEITIDKNIYTVGESKEVVIKVDMNYSYPYVGVSPSSDKPTVTVSAELLDEQTSVSYSDEAWADSDMHCTAELKVPLEKVTEETVAEYKGEVPLNISIKFNDATKYNTTLTLRFESNSSGIRDMEADRPDNRKIKYYNIFGVEVDDSYQGFVISSDGRKIIR